MGIYKGSHIEREIGLNTSILDLLRKENGNMSGRLFGVLGTLYHYKNYCGKKIKTIGDLLNLAEGEIFRMRNFGEISLRELNSILTKYQLPKIDIDVKKKFYSSKRRGLYL